jgi:hypothetical protein
MAQLDGSIPISAITSRVGVGGVAREYDGDPSYDVTLECHSYDCVDTRQNTTANDVTQATPGSRHRGN